MARNIFSIPIFFIIFRETLEAAIVVSVLLGLAKQIVHDDSSNVSSFLESTEDKDNTTPSAQPQEQVDVPGQRKRLLRKLKIQIFLGAGLGLLISIAIGGAIIGVWVTKATNLWERAEALWEAIFSLIAAVVIFFMGITMLKMDRAKAKWRVKLERAFTGQNVDTGTRTGKWVFFMLPFITVLREGLEAVLFVGGVSLGQPGSSIPLATIVGIICGVICGFLIYQFASRSTLTVFLVVMTNFLLLIGAGLFARSIAEFQENSFNHLLGGEAGESGGTGPGTFDVRGNVWHLDCCSPKSNGWLVFNGMFGWSNNASVGTVLGYVFYWVAVVIALIHLKFTEGRTMLLGRHSAAGRRRQAEAAATAAT